MPQSAASVAASGGGDDDQAVVAARGIRKVFPGVIAVDGVDLDVRRGEILALVGQNGAGKSTLIQILAGVHAAGGYDGTIELSGRPYLPRSVAEAERAGIAMVPQEVNVCPDLTVAQNMYLGAEPSRFGLVNQAVRDAEAARHPRRVRGRCRSAGRDGNARPCDPATGPDRQGALQAGPILILDEPTTALTRREAERLFDRLRALKAHGVASIFVSHRLAEVFAIADRIAVMRDGRMLSIGTIAETSREVIVEAMIGRKVPMPERGLSGGVGEIALEVDRLVVRDIDERRPPHVDGISFTVRQGEILGLYGLLGAGCAEALLAIFGAWHGPFAGACESMASKPGSARPLMRFGPVSAWSHRIGGRP